MVGWTTLAHASAIGQEHDTDQIQLWRNVQQKDQLERPKRNSDCDIVVSTVSKTDEPTHTVVGECYVRGIMKRETLNNSGFSWALFDWYDGEILRATNTVYMSVTLRYGFHFLLKACPSVMLQTVVQDVLRNRSNELNQLLALSSVSMLVEFSSQSQA